MNAEQKPLPPGGIREVLQVALPLILSMGSFTLMQFCDRMFLAWYSREAIQAALPAGILAFTVICLFSELAGYANAFVSQYHGAGQKPGCAQSTTQGIFIALISWPLIIALIPAARWLLHHSHHAPDVLAAELQYVTILLLAGGSAPLNMAIGSFFTGRGRTRVTMLANVSANLVNLTLAYALIFGRWGMPEMGIAGAAIASAVAGFISPAIMLGLFLSPRNNDEYGTRRAFRINPALFWRMIRFGFPSAINVLLDVGAFTVFVLLTGRLQGAQMATSNIAFSINNIAFMPLLGLSITTMTLVGKYQGARNPRTAARATGMTLLVGATYMLVIGLSFLLIPGRYYALFTAAGGQSYTLDELLPIGRQLLVMLAIWGLFDTANLMLAGALKGAGDTRFVLLWSLIAAWGIWVPGQIWLITRGVPGILSLWIWMTFYIVILALGYYLRFRSGIWRSIELIEPTTAPVPVPSLSDTKPL